MGIHSLRLDPCFLSKLGYVKAQVDIVPISFDLGDGRSMSVNANSSRVLE